jgi:hypothetical protein
MLPTWKKALDAPGAVQMGVLKKILMGRSEWWNLTPDQGIFASGGNTQGDVLNLAARHKDGRWIMVYLAAKAAFSINMDKFTAGRQAQASWIDPRTTWIDPRTGDSVPAGIFPGSGVQAFSTPEGWEDALLILESPKGQGKF